MDRTVQLPGMMEVASAVDYIQAVSHYTVAAAVLDIQYYTAFVAAAARGSPFDRSSDIVLGTLGIEVALASVHNQLHLLGLQAADQTHSKAGRVAQIVAERPRQFPHWQTLSLEQYYKHIFLGDRW